MPQKSDCCGGTNILRMESWKIKAIGQAAHGVLRTELLHSPLWPHLTRRLLRTLLVTNKKCFPAETTFSTFLPNFSHWLVTVSHTVQLLAQSGEKDGVLCGRLQCLSKPDHPFPLFPSLSYPYLFMNHNPAPVNFFPDRLPALQVVCQIHFFHSIKQSLGLKTISRGFPRKFYLWFEPLILTPRADQKKSFIKKNQHLQTFRKVVYTLQGGHTSGTAQLFAREAVGEKGRW